MTMLLCYNYPPRMGTLIDFDHVFYRYQPAEGPAILALSDLSLQIGEGEFVAVVGANGSGKSTFARLTNGLLAPSEGKVLVAGLDTRKPENRARVHAEVGMVFQFPEDQIVSTTVEEDAAFGPENLALKPDEIRRRVEDALQLVGLWEMRSRPPHLLSAGQTQRLALAGVLAMHPHCIVFDEASTMLDPVGRRMMINTMQRLHEEGTTILFITHFMDEAVLADRLIVLDHGRVVKDGSPAQIFADPTWLSEQRLDLPPAALASARIREVLPDLPQGLLTLTALLQALPAYMGNYRAAAPPPNMEPDSEKRSPLIEVDGLGHIYMRGTPLEHRALEGASFHVQSGRVHGLLGKTGSGKSTLLQHLNGLLHPQEGTVRVGQFDLNDPGTDRRQVVRQVGLVFQNPETQFFEHYVGDEISFGPRQLKVEEPLAQRVQWAMAQVGLDFAAFKDRPLFTLSGGERRKVALASTLALRPSILLLDEPTAGLDPYSRLELLEKLAAMREAGMNLVLSSHQMEDLAFLAHQLTVFNHGKDVLSGSADQVFAQSEDLQSYGLEPPVAVQIAAALRDKSWPIPDTVLTTSDLVNAMRQALAGGEA